MSTDNTRLEHRLTRIEITQNNILATLEVMRGDFREWQKEIEAEHRRVSNQVSSLERGESTRAERWRTHEGEHKRMDRKSLTGDVIAGFFGSVTALIASIFNP